MTPSLYAWTTRLPDGSTSIVGTIVHGLHTPLIASRRSIMESMAIVAQAHANASGQTVYLDRFDHADSLTTLKPVEIT